MGVAFRIFAFTFLSTLATIAVALLLSILGTVVYSRVEHIPPDLMFAYKHIAFPIAIVGGSIALMATLIMEARSYRQGKVLAAIERTALNH